MRFAATLLSRIFDPFLMLASLLVLTLIRGGEANIALWFYAFGLMIGLPVLLFVMALRTGFISDWDMTKREERPRVLGIFLILELIAFLVLRMFVFVWTAQMILVIFLSLVGFTLITLRWKISGHALAAALFSGFVVSWYGSAWWPTLLIVPLVGWARVVDKKHSLLQVIAGAIYAWSIVAAITVL